MNHFFLLPEKVYQELLEKANNVASARLGIMLGPQMDSIETTSPVIQHSSGHSSAQLGNSSARLGNSSAWLGNSSARLGTQSGSAIHHSSSSLQGISASPRARHDSTGRLDISTSTGAKQHSSERLGISTSSGAARQHSSERPGISTSSGGQYHSSGRLGGSTSQIGGTPLGRLEISPGAKSQEVTLDIFTSPGAQHNTSFPGPTAASTPRRPGGFAMRQAGASASAQMRQGASYTTSMRQTSSSSSPRRHGTSSYSATSPGRHGSSNYATSGLNFLALSKKSNNYALELFILVKYFELLNSLSHFCAILCVGSLGVALPRLLYAGVPLWNLEPHPLIRHISAKFLTLF